MTYWATAWTLGSEAAVGPPARGPVGPGDPRAVGLAGGRARPLARLGRAVDRARRPGRSSSSTAVPKRSSPRRWAASRPGSACSRPGSATATTRPSAASSSCRPGAVLPPRSTDPRERAPSSRSPGGPATPTSCPAPGLFGAPERFDRRPFSAADVRETVVDVAVESLKARGEPASADRLLGEILVGLDRAGQLRRLVADRDAARCRTGEPSDDR